jgi:Ca2+-binding RTX toxin-like protein
MLYGGDYDDFIVGESGSDFMEGESGNDLIEGDLGDDTLIGGSGNDILVGGSDNDIMQGGPGEDVFRLTNGQEPFYVEHDVHALQDYYATIEDFNSSEDVIFVFEDATQYRLVSFESGTYISLKDDNIAFVQGVEIGYGDLYDWNI